MKATHTLSTTTDYEPGMSPTDLLRGAVRYLQRHGWTQHQFFDLLANPDGLFPPACASGAIITAATGRCLPSGTCTPDDEDPETMAAIAAMRVFADWLDGGYAAWVDYPASPIDVIGDWNDHDGRTIDEVIECLTDAANDYDWAHTTGGAR